MKKLLVLWALLMAVAIFPGIARAEWFNVAVEGGGIATVDREAVLNPGGTTASTSVSVAKIPLAASEHSPHCTNGRWTLSGIPIAGNRTSECVRVCVRPPAGYEINAAAGISGTTSHAWSQTFNPQWFDDKKIACIFVKNWSDGQASVATLTVGVCRAGAGCANTAPPPPPAPSPVARERPYSLPLTARQASIRN